MGYAVPDRDDDRVLGREFALHEAVEFPLRPRLREEARAQDHHAQTRCCEPAVDCPPQAVAWSERELVVPDVDPALAEPFRDGAHQRVLVFAGVADEHAVQHDGSLYEGRYYLPPTSSPTWVARGARARPRRTSKRAPGRNPLSTAAPEPVRTGPGWRPPRGRPQGVSIGRPHRKGEDVNQFHSHPLATFCLGFPLWEGVLSAEVLRSELDGLYKLLTFPVIAPELPSDLFRQVDDHLLSRTAQRA